jgi:hypothetical protein
MFEANAEPSLEEMLDDPVVQLRMIGAGLKPESVRTCFMDARRRLREHGEADLSAVAVEPSSADQ